jgi:magnesium transporter
MTTMRALSFTRAILVDVIVDCAVYERGRRQAGALALEEAFEASQQGGSFVWLGLHEPDEQEFDAVRREFDLHPLAVEDAIKAHQRPKLELYGRSLFIVLKPAQWVEDSGTIEFGEILIFIGKGFIITVRHGEAPLHEVRLRLEEEPALLECGPSAALYAIVDRIVDDYQPVVAAVDHGVDAVEREVFSATAMNAAESIYKLKRDVLELHAVVNPLAAPLEVLARGRHELVSGKVKPYFRDVHDHLLRVIDEVESNRDLLTSVLAANLSQVTVRQNEDVRRISAWAAIIAVPTAIAGIYGMNFEHMPELGWTFGYPLALATIVAAAGGLYLYFRKIGWL